MRQELLVGYAMAMAGAAAYGFAQVATRIGVSEMTTPLVAATISMFSGMIALMFLNLREFKTATSTQPRAVFLIVLSGIFSSMGVTSMYFSLSYVPVTIASPIVSVNPLLTILYASIFLRQSEKVTARIVAGAVLVVIGVILVTLG